MLKMRDLAHRPDLGVGPLKISPATRLVEGPAGSTSVEPIVMQVLLRLLDASGAVVTRDELFDHCWGSAMVGDASLNRAAAKLRRVLERVAPGQVGIETIPRTGYRVAFDDGSAMHGWTRTEPQSRIREVARLVRRNRWIAAAMALIVVAVLFAGIKQWTGRDDPVSVAVVAGEGEGSAILARDVTATLAGSASPDADMLILADDTDTRSDYRAQLSTEPVGNRLRANVNFVAASGRRLLWSASVEGAAGDSGNVKRQLAARLGHVLTCAIGSGAARQINDAELPLYLNVCDLESLESWGGQETLERQASLLGRIAHGEPQFADAWAKLAVVEARLGESAPFPELVDNPQRRAFRSAAREHIARARALQPAMGLTYLAEAELAGHARWAQRLALEEQGLAADPGSAALHRSYSETLKAVGRMTEASNSAGRAVALAPLSPSNRAAFAISLAHAGQIDQARRELEALERTWPDSPSTIDALFYFHLRFGDSVKVERMIETGQIRETPLIGRDFLRVRDAPTAANVAALVNLGRRYAGRRPHGVASNLQMLGQLGQIDEAYSLVQSPRALVYLRYVTEVLFRPHMRRVRLDPRFMLLTNRLGLLQYWRSTDRWPDFCRDPLLPYDCRAEADRLSPPD